MLLIWIVLAFTAMTALSVAVDLVHWAQQLSKPVHDACQPHTEDSSDSPIPRRPPPFQR